MKRILGLLIFAGALLQGAPVFVLIPPDVTAPPGGITGWGFAVTPQNDFAFSVISSFVVDPSDPAFGTYTDLIGLLGGPDSGYLLPPVVWFQPFAYDPNPALQSGAGYFQLAPNATGVFTALLHIDVEVYSLLGGLPDEYLETDGVEVPISITVAPEPASWMLVGPLAGLGLMRRRRRRG